MIECNCDSDCDVEHGTECLCDIGDHFQELTTLHRTMTTLTAQRNAAEKVCEALDLWERTGVLWLPQKVRAALTEWRRTKDA